MPPAAAMEILFASFPARSGLGFGAGWGKGQAALQENQPGVQALPGLGL